LNSRFELALSVVCCIAASLHSSAARAQAGEPATLSRTDTEQRRLGEQRLMLLVRTPGDEGVVARLRAELVHSDWEIVEVRPDDRKQAPPIAEVAIRQGAAAAVRINRARGLVELWISPGLSGDHAKGQPLSEVIRGQHEREQDWILALRTTEALRARGLDLGPSPSPMRQSTQSDVSAPERAHEPQLDPTPGSEATEGGATRSGPSVSLELGPAASFSPGGLAVQPHLHLGASAKVARGWTLAAFTMAPVVNTKLRGPEGNARISVWFVGTGIDVRALRVGSGELAVGGGYALTLHRLQGNSQPGYRDASDSVIASAPFLRCDLRWQFAPLWQLDLMALAGATFPKVAVEFASREAATWGRPLLLGALALRGPVTAD
jgi:hypothetical protein